jgi:hypothetical protein
VAVVLGPVDYVASGLFGESSTISWHIPPSGTLDELLHAKWQHDIVVQIRAWCRDTGHQRDPIGYLAQSTSERRATVTRKFNGKAFASAGNLLRWVTVTGIEVYPVPQDASDLIPDGIAE